MKRLVFLLLFAGCAHVPIVGRVFSATDHWVTAVLTTLERAPDYEADCGFFCRLRFGTESPRAYQGQLTDSVGKHTWVWMFAQRGDTLPHLGTRARWHLHPQEIYQLGSTLCAGQMGCPHEFGWSLQSNSDVQVLP